MSDNEGKLEECCTLWKAVSNDGSLTYFNGKDAKGRRVVAFINKKASPENQQPTIRVYFQNERDEDSKGSNKSQKGKKQKKEETDDIPF